MNRHEKRAAKKQNAGAKPDLVKLMEAALIDMGRETLATWKQVAEFDHSDDDLVFDLVERAIDASDTVALCVVHEDRVLIIKHGGKEEGRVTVIPCADVDQVARAALEYGDELARNTIRHVMCH